MVDQREKHCPVSATGRRPLSTKFNTEALDFGFSVLSPFRSRQKACLRQATPTPKIGDEIDLLPVMENGDVEFRHTGRGQA